MGAFEITCLIMCWISVAICLFGLIFSVIECIRSRREVKKKEIQYLTQGEIEAFLELVKKKGHDSKENKK